VDAHGVRKYPGVDGYEISTDPARLDVDAILRYLAEESYWARGRTRESLERAMAHSLNFGLYVPGGALAGFARVVSDRSTFAYLCDVFVLDEHRGRGLGVRLVEAVLGHPELEGVRSWHLGTADAHGLYERFGFAPADPRSVMVLRRDRPDAGTYTR
jgi:GNAT superfamily N-acetyltransferase